MKLLVLCLLPLVLAAPQDFKRFIIPGFDVGSLFDLQTLKCDVQIIIDVIGSNATESACETECHNVIKDGNLLNHGCPLVCHSVQNLAHYFHETPKPGEQNLACGGLTGTK